MSPIAVLTLIGSVASVVALAIAAPTIRSRSVHVAYAVVLTWVVGSATIESERATSREHNLETRISEMESRSTEARAILGTYSYTTSDVGQNRGFVLSSFSFLEKHRAVWPDSYLLAKTLVVDGLRITASEGTDGGLAERRRRADGAAAMKAILRGIAALDDSGGGR